MAETIVESTAKLPHPRLWIDGWPRLARTITTEVDAGQLAKRVCQVVAEEFGFSRALLATVDEKHDCIVGRAGYDPSLPASMYMALLRLYRVPLAPRPDGRFLIAAWCVKHREQAYVADASYDSFRPAEATQRPFLIKALGTAEYALTPIVYDGQAVGVLAVDKKGKQERITPADLNVLRDVAALLALRFGPLLRKEREGDRRRSAHDSLAESVTAAVTDPEHKRNDLRLRRELLESVIHDLKAPTQSIVGFAELLQLGRVGALTPEQAEFVARIISGGEELVEVIDRLLTIVTLDSGELAHAEETVSGRAIVAAISERLGGKALRADVRLISELHDQLPQLRGDPKQIDAVFQNLIANAIDAARPGDVVRVTAPHHGDGQFVRFSIIREGAGGSEPAAPPFDPEWNRYAARRRSHGLGLAIVKRIVERHGGDVWAEGDPLTNLSIQFTLPCATASLGSEQVLAG